MYRCMNEWEVYRFRDERWVWLGIEMDRRVCVWVCMRVMMIFVVLMRVCKDGYGYGYGIVLEKNEEVWMKKSDFRRVENEEELKEMKKFSRNE